MPDQLSVTRPPRIVYITGHGHSGSTLLDLLLGNHPRMLSLGEVELLSEHAAGDTSRPFGNPVKPCACGVQVSACPFWNEVADKLLTQQSQADVSANPWTCWPTSQRVPPSLTQNRFHLLKIVLMLGSQRLFDQACRYSSYLRGFADSTRNSWRIFDAVAELHPTAYMIDASKNPLRLKLLHWRRPESVWQIHLVRDGRAIAASAKRLFGSNVETSAGYWAGRYRDVCWLQRGIPEQRRCLVRYEDLCRDPEHVLRSLCDFLRIEFSPLMLEMHDSGHGLDGNRLRFDPQHRARIKLDERWRRELSPGEFRDFDRVAGRLNRRLGYG